LEKDRQRKKKKENRIQRSPLSLFGPNVVGVGSAWKIGVAEQRWKLKMDFPPDEGWKLELGIPTPIWPVPSPTRNINTPACCANLSFVCMCLAVCHQLYIINQL
jgi:hypothetical protein